MGRFFITGSSDGLGSLTAGRLIGKGHQVVLHARNGERACDASAACPVAEATKELAAAADKLGPYDAIIHNAGVYVGMERVPGKSGLPTLFAVDTLAPYLLTYLMEKPKRLMYVSSGIHAAGPPPKLHGKGRLDSKLRNVMLLCYSVAPGWVPTNMDGPSAPDRVDDGVDTYAVARFKDVT
ncbi:uncharacterized protein P884DRAFT_280611 [Thermothelomyces heterothallicus CBS 202.75]|uniref:uncharacterized protein n=1 Tax=Thermothelomyces heterothallicus CBS 202.75 TaxID=1149848 RepID=UPI003744AA6D